MAYAGKSGQPRSAVGVAKSGTGAKGTLVAGVAIGVLVGVGLALLLAPGSGRDTRHRLKRGLRRIGNRGRDAWDDLRLELRRARRQLRRARRLRQQVAGEVADALPET